MRNLFPECSQLKVRVRERLERKFRNGEQDADKVFKEN